MIDRRAFGTLFAAAALGQQMPGKSAPDRAAQGRTGPDRTGPDPAAERLSVMMWTLKGYGTFEDNLGVVADAGYRHVELVDEYKQWAGADRARVLARMSKLGISVDAMAGVGVGFADPAGGELFVAELKRIVPLARELGSPQMILLSGKRVGAGTADDDQRQHGASIETLKRAADVLAGAGLMGVIEPIDRLEQPLIYLDGVTEAFAIVRAVGSPNVKVLYDLYHEQRTHGNLIEKLVGNVDLIGLVHVADVPGRHQPGTGEIHYDSIYSKLDELGYKRRIAMEFYPVGDPVTVLRAAKQQALRGLA